MTKKYISAGAGSGKTYRITTDVAQMVKDGTLNPDQVIMTTFTKAAAQELCEKAKNELAKLGLLREAQQMEHALIGTVHSVANTFLTKYWYLLGITPDAAAMDEDEVKLYRDHSLRGMLSHDNRKFLYRFAETYNITYISTNERGAGINYEFWKKDLCSVLDYMQWYDIDDEQLKKSLETTETFIKCLQPNTKDTLQSVLTDEFYQEVEDFFGIKNKLTDKQSAARDFYYYLRTISEVTDNDIDLFKLHKDLQISNKGVKYKLSGPATQKVTNYLIGTTHFTKESAEDQRRYASIIFSLAVRWQKEYRQYKDEHHLIDFNDMEEMFYQLLKMEEVQKDIKSRFKWLFVDEFQDSNPMQVNIFRQLSSLLNTVYVGDKKQAIYGFRGSDTDLTEVVANSISDNEPLEYSFRSVKPLVEFSNAIFTKVFSQMTDVALTMPEKNGNPDTVEHPLRLWPYEKNDVLALQIQQLHLREGIAYKDIAVLARKNDHLDKLADELRKLKVPVCRESTDIKDSRTGRLMKALLTLVNTPSNQLARAEVAYLTQPDCHITAIIENRLDHLNANIPRAEYLIDIPLLQRLNQLRKFQTDETSKYTTNLLGYQSISALVESLIIELDLYAVVQSWENALSEETNLQVFIDLAHKYEEASAKMARPATVLGFIDFFTNQLQKGAANEEGVRLFTYHKAKGLEWKVVIMMSLDKDPSEATDIAIKNMLGCRCHREQKPTMDNFNPPMTISLVRNIYGTSNDTKSALLARLQQHPLWETICDQEIAESARLLYVGVTRARNILILAAKAKDGAINLNWFRAEGCNNLDLLYDAKGRVDIFRIGMPFAVETIDPASDDLLSEPDRSTHRVHNFGTAYSSLDNPLYLSPSKAGNTPHNINVINDKENRMHVRNKSDEEALMGDFIHQVFCCCDDNINVEQIVKLRNSYGFTDKNMPDPGRLQDSWKYLTDTLEAKYGKAIKRHHEKPFRHLDSKGHIVSGYIDLIWETKEAYIVVDYKTCPGNYSLVFDPVSEHYAGRHGDQLDCYQRALEAEGKKNVAARIIYYPVTQFLVEVK